MERKLKLNPLLLFAVGFVVGGAGLYFKLSFTIGLWAALFGIAVLFENPMAGIIGAAFGYIFLPDTLCLALLYGIFGLYLLRKIFLKNRPLQIEGQETMIYVYFLMLAVQTFTSMIVAGSIRDFAIHTGGLMLFMMIVNESYDEKRLHKIITAVVVSTTILALIGIVQYIVGVDIKEGWLDEKFNTDIRARVYSIFGNPNIFAEYLVMTMPLTVGVLWSSKRDGVRISFLAMFAVQLAALFMTMSRGGWLGLALSLLIFIVIVRKELLLLAIPMAGAAVYFIPQTFISRFMTIFNMNESSASYRLQIWKVAIRIIKDNFLLGLGLGYMPFKRTFERYLSTLGIFHAHNTFIEIFAEMGVLGFFFFVLFVIAIFVALFRYPIKSEDRYMRTMGAAMVASFSGMLFHGMFENIFYMTKITTTFYLLLGIAFSLARMCRRRKGLELMKERTGVYGEESII